MAQISPMQRGEEMDALVATPEVRVSSGLAKRVSLAVGVLGMTAAVAAVALPRSTLTSDVDMIGQKEQRVQITPSFPACSKSGENCLPSGCCQVTGHTCFLKNEKSAFCHETCSTEKGWLCGIPPNGMASVPVKKILTKSLYCFSVYTENTGSTKKSHELDLLKTQKQHEVSIFTCDAWDVFSDTSVDIGGYNTIKVNDEFNEFHRVKRKETGAWVNWAMFYQIWKEVRNLGRWEAMSWTVKVDPDAVFIPTRLHSWLDNKLGEPPHGLYFENCKNVQYGFFGNLEVLSHEATNVLTKYLEDCHAVYAPCADTGCDWKWGPWGEDVFAQRCLDRHYVDKVEAFDMTLDGACAADRPEGQKKNKKWRAEDCGSVQTAAVHPFKTPKDYFACLGQMTHMKYD